MRRLLRYASYAIVFLFGLSLGYFFIGAQAGHNALASASQQTIFGNLTGRDLVQLPASEISAAANIVAVNQANNTGVLNKMSVEIRSGKGRVLIDTNPFIEPDTQYSAETAIRVAQNITHADLSNKDIIITFESQAKLVGGPSAGAAMALAAIAAMEGKQVKKDAVITGTVEPDGTIGQIGGVLEKAEAAGTNGMKLFLVPKGQGEVMYYEQQLVKKPINARITALYIKYVPHTVNLSDYVKEWGLGVLEVSNIEEAARVVLG